MRQVLTVGILAESKNRWERRAPLTPHDVKWLVERHIPVEVLSSSLRIFRDHEFKRAGAKIVTRFKQAKLLIGVKEPLPAELLNRKIYMVFSHTTKGQPANRPLLREALRQRITLIDYEHIVDLRRQRLVYFGRFAGICGMIDGLHFLGRRYEAQGIETPLLHVRRALDYKDYKQARRHLRWVARETRKKGFPLPITPFIVGITGHGNVSQGAQEVLDIFRPIEIHPKDIMVFIRHQKKRNKQIYKIVFNREEKLRSKKRKGFYFEEYLEYPDRFESNLDQYLPHINMLINASYWTKRYPRLVSEKMIKKLTRQKKKPRLVFIGDLSCDVSGTIEITKKTTTPGNPIYTYHPETGQIQDGFWRRGIAVLAVDNLPCELPKDASVDFSALIRDYVYQVAAHGALDITEHAALPGELRRAVITQNGRFTPPFRYMRQYL
ncbi:MAG: hypothetical protein COV74_08690 [Candidatus Omnitrophica bacterium CG11_big_fil_rev_8_21_14_0_20_45_26]|uniref:Alanine dehydrogenase/pyridine nucleotide transhydrogenase N-terminal domain-containing protein n=1 Tax=Candidatus Abzuiibacterium crystallinum TaxID=1974748 RepID=A0A2H0LMD3_9BACT|nr:MAG: hypothetical protein COV74_08690 [Candidatus Omnitrophica bacterium CG11_big_fil_rev_8_21_14_0_20_45_26]PIW63737.1 MAG: hypothetical protein COW12_09575 [Candidatus Omnitrophica bacterium CG12_big_fil_rev_8_21_14_0_65_45_16]